MTSSLLRHARSACVLSLAALAVTAAPAAADISSIDASGCSVQPVSQSFLANKDKAWYFLAPGGDFASPEATLQAGWQLSGGAAIVSTTRADGTVGHVLDLPSGSKAVSPTMCITTDYPTARMRVRNVVGGEGVQFYVSYAGTNTWTIPKNTGQVHGGAMRWQLPAPINLQPTKVSGWQLVRFTFVPGGRTSRFQIADVYVDPKMR